jgi:hypothetical protein
MLKGIIKVDPKKDVCHSMLVIEILMQHFSPKTKEQRPLEVAPAQA